MKFSKKGPLRVFKEMPISSLINEYSVIILSYFKRLRVINNTSCHIQKLNTMTFKGNKITSNENFWKQFNDINHEGVHLVIIIEDFRSEDQAD